MKARYIEINSWRDVTGTFISKFAEKHEVSLSNDIFFDFKINVSKLRSTNCYFTPDNDIPFIKSVFRQVFDVMGLSQHYDKMSGEGDLHLMSLINSEA